jgi:hypothetical protein
MSLRVRLVDSVTGIAGWWKSTNGAAHTKPAMSGAAFASGTLVNGVAVDVSMAGAPIPCTVAINPGSGDTVKLHYTVDGTNYIERASVTAYAEDVIDAPVIGLRFTRFAGTGTTSTWAVV